MNNIEWTQTDKIVILSVTAENKQIKFKLEPTIINFIINHTPKIFYFNVEIAGKLFQYFVDFTELKPIISVGKKLSMKVKTEVQIVENQASAYGHYSIIRGESFMERFLGMGGWQALEYKFKIILLDEQQNIQPEKILKLDTIENKTIVENNTVKQTQILKSSVCKKCGYQMPENYDICPECFTEQFEIEKDVDIAI